MILCSISTWHSPKSDRGWARAVSNRSGHQLGVKDGSIMIPVGFAGFCIFEALEIYGQAGALDSVHPGQADRASLPPQLHHHQGHDLRPGRAWHCDPAAATCTSTAHAGRNHNPTRTRVTHATPICSIRFIVRAGEEDSQGGSRTVGASPAGGYRPHSLVYFP